MQVFSPGLYPCFQTEKERIYESGACASTNDASSGRPFTLSHSISGTPHAPSVEDSEHLTLSRF